MVNLKFCKMFFEFAKVFSKMCRKILCERLEGVFFMYDYNELKENIKAQKADEFEALKAEISGIEAFWERLFKGVLETTTSKSERDFNVSSI